MYIIYAFALSSFHLKEILYSNKSAFYPTPPYVVEEDVKGEYAQDFNQLSSLSGQR